MTGIARWLHHCFLMHRAALHENGDASGEIVRITPVQFGDGNHLGDRQNLRTNGLFTRSGVNRAYVRVRSTAVKAVQYGKATRLACDAGSIRILDPTGGGAAGGIENDVSHRATTGVGKS